jgi:glycerol-3-phosphate dehydrogenase
MPPASLSNSPPVLILGAGINGACVARELLLNGVAVTIADATDIACGATSKSSRLIHGGLRYLEYGDVALVRESLDERARLLRLAPQFVRPLRLFIPIRRRHGGLLQAGMRFLKFERLTVGRRLARLVPVSERGLWAVRTGLTLYDQIAKGGRLPSHTVGRVDQAGVPALDRSQFHWLCSYYDAQMLFPERFTVALLEDCRRIAEQQRVAFEVLTYQTASRDKGRITLQPQTGGPSRAFTPAVVVNATGAWGDATLRDLHTGSPPLFSGTKGSHIITRQPALRSALGEDAVYAEARDGRLVFVLPFNDSVLIGTTDVPFAESPGEAVATTEEIAYLVRIINEIFPDVALLISEIDAHYCGVRPLPNVRTSRAGAIPRGHSIETQVVDGLVVETLVGGKLTTCRAFGEFAADRILARIGRLRSAGTLDRPVPGAEDYPTAAVHERIVGIAHQTGFDLEQVRVIWPLVGTRAESILKDCSTDNRSNLPGTTIPLGFVDWSIRHEWVQTLGDLIERRLMLAWSSHLNRDLLRVSAERLAHAGKLATSDIDSAVATCGAYLAEHYGAKVP